MTGRVLLPAACSSTTTCTLLSAQNGSVFAKTPKSKLSVAATGGAPIAFAADAKDDFVDFAWLDNEETDSVGVEAAQALDDLLRLESVFGDTEVDSTSGSSCSDVRSVDIDGGLREDRTVRCVEDALEGEDAEGLLRLFDDDLQDALLALPGGDLDSCSDKGKEGCSFETSAFFSRKVDCGGYDSTSDNTSVDCCGRSDTTVDCSVPADCGARGTTPPPLRAEEVTVGLKTADDAGTGLVKAAGPSNSGSGGGLGERTEEGDGHAYPETALSAEKIAASAAPVSTTAVASPAAAAASAETASAPGVPTRLLDAIDLWESANAHAKIKKKAAARAARQREAAAAAAAAARGAGVDRRGAVTTRSKAKKIGKAATNGGGSGGGGSADIIKKKKNEFGKRRRSSGGGGATAPVLDAAAASASATPAKTKGKGKEKEKGKKVDPLVAIRDARSLSKKPLIVQWLKSDGCDSDAEAEAALGKAVGSLSAISRYWGGGG